MSSFPNAGRRLATASVAAGIALAMSGTALAVDGFRTQLEKWVETQQIISEEESDWEVERETMRASRNLLRDEKAALEEEIAQLETEGTEADDERSALLEQREAYQRANDEVLELRIAAAERRILELAPRLPAPLQEKLELLLVQIPEDPESSDLQLGQRLMNVLGVLAQAEKFNDTATFVGETRAVEGDQKVQVRTLYWGLAQAIFVDSQGRTAGIGRPSSSETEGWSFANSGEITSEAQLLLDIYEGNVDVIEFVPMPVEIR